MEKVQKNFDEANIRQVLPALSAHLKDEFSSVRSAVIANHAIITRTSDSVSNLSKRMYDVFSGRTSLCVNLNATETNIVLDNERTDGCTKDITSLQAGTGMSISIVLH